uniref:Peptidase M3A/M3B catalytic domain-containing protein n=1 Tax=Meloidogyne incognita TaxID=6306 RepID=A0A914LPU1_MELIC
MQTIEDFPPLYEYFYFGKMLEGFEEIVNLLYGITFVKSVPKSGECWEGNVLKLEVYRKDEFNDKIFLGLIYIDIDQRDSKLQGDCHFTVRCSKKMGHAMHSILGRTVFQHVAGTRCSTDFAEVPSHLMECFLMIRKLQNGEFQTPIVVVSLGFNYAYSLDLDSNGTICEIEMRPHQVENFFHEMGHAMHSILGRTVFQHVAGTRCSTDFAEVPSHLMECFFNDPKIFQKICRSKQTGRMLDEDLVLALIKRRKLFPAVKYTQQAIYSLFDLELHGEHAEAISQNKFTTTDLFIKLHKQALPQFHIETDYAFHQRMSHLVSYGAKYYSYLLARASAAMIYNKLFANNLIYEKANGEKWAEVQSHGGEYSSDVLLAKALGTSTVPSVEQLTRSLIMEAKSPKF